MAKLFHSRGNSGAGRVRALTTLALLSALMILFAFTPLGFIPIAPAVALTLMHIPVLVGLLCQGFSSGLFLGFLFGALSLIRALTPTQPIDALFVNPLVSVLPRLLVPCAAWLAYRGAAAAVKGKARLPTAWMCSALVGTLTNTVAVLGMLYLVYGARLAEMLGVASTGVLAALGGIVLTNGLAEAAFAAVVVPALLGALTRRRADLPGLSPERRTSE